MTSSCLTLNLANAKESSVSKIAVIGDSLTQGYGLMSEQNLVSQLQKRLSEDNYGIELLNIGVSGDTTAVRQQRYECKNSSHISELEIK